ncbi:winged helix-turn-helix transcriptional regulator [Crossiella sp. NPDC003009]
MVSRHACAEIPPRVEYELTALGEPLHEPLHALGRWAEEHAAEVLTAREACELQSRVDTSSGDAGHILVLVTLR